MRVNTVPILVSIVRTSLDTGSEKGIDEEDMAGKTEGILRSAAAVLPAVRKGRNSARMDEENAMLDMLWPAGAR
jgi:hypothetical protein